MQLKKIQEAIAGYKKHRAGERFFANQFKWEMLKNFQDNWDIEAPDLAAMYDKSLQSNHTRRWWKGENFHPKEMMIRFLQQSPDFGRRMFRDLFDEEKDFESRISRFQFGCDVLLEEYKKDHPLSIDNNHFHADNHLVSLYLGLHSPQLYTVIFYDSFLPFCKNIGTTNLPGPYDYERFFKIIRAINIFLQKDEELLKIHHRKLDLQKDYPGPDLWLAQDFYEWAGK